MINPYLNTNLKDQLAQGHNVGDIDTDSSGNKWRWSGVSWDREGGGGGGSMGSSQAPNYTDTINQALNLYKTNLQPTINRLEGLTPQITQAFDSAKTALKATEEPLKQRYQTLLDEIKRKEGVATAQQTTTTSNELAKRGILPSSTLAQQEITRAVSPITEQYTNQYSAGVADRETQLADLAYKIANMDVSKLGQNMSLAEAIAQIEAGGVTGGISTGTNIFGNLLSSYDASQTRAMQQKQIEDEAAARQQLFGDLPSLIQSVYGGGTGGATTTSNTSNNWELAADNLAKNDLQIIKSTPVSNVQSTTKKAGSNIISPGAGAKPAGSGSIFDPLISLIGSIFSPSGYSGGVRPGVGSR